MGLGWGHHIKISVFKACRLFGLSYQEGAIRGRVWKEEIKETHTHSKETKERQKVG